MSKYVYPQCFEIVELNRNNGSAKLYLNKKEVYHRLRIEPIVKMEDRNCEVVDEDTDTIYVVPEWMIPQIIEKIEYERMTKDWKQTVQFTGEQEETLRIVELMLWKSGEFEQENKVKSQRLEKKQPEVYDYETLLNESLPLISEEAYMSERRRLLPIYKLRGEAIPSILNTKHPNF